MQVQDVMTRSVVSVEPYARVDEVVAGLLRKRRRIAAVEPGIVFVGTSIQDGEVSKARRVRNGVDDLSRQRQEFVFDLLKPLRNLLGQTLGRLYCVVTLFFRSLLVARIPGRGPGSANDHGRPFGWNGVK